MTGFIFDRKIQSKRGVFVGRVEDSLHVKTSNVSFGKAQKPHLAENSSQWEVCVKTHVVQMGRESFLTDQYRQKIVSAHMGGAGDIEFKGGESTFMRTHPLAVEPDLGSAIDAVKEQFDAATEEAGGICRCRRYPPVPLLLSNPP